MQFVSILLFQNRFASPLPFKLSARVYIYLVNVAVLIAFHSFVYSLLSIVSSIICVPVWLDVDVTLFVSMFYYCHYYELTVLLLTVCDTLLVYILCTVPITYTTILLISNLLVVLIFIYFYFILTYLKSIGIPLLLIF